MRIVAMVSEILAVHTKRRNRLRATSWTATEIPSRRWLGQRNLIASIYSSLHRTLMRIAFVMERQSRWRVSWARKHSRSEMLLAQAEGGGSAAPQERALAHGSFDQIQSSKGKPNGGGECRSLHRWEDGFASVQTFRTFWWVLFWWLFEEIGKVGCKWRDRASYLRCEGSPYGSFTSPGKIANVEHLSLDFWPFSIYPALGLGYTSGNLAERAIRRKYRVRYRPNYFY